MARKIMAAAREKEIKGLPPPADEAEKIRVAQQQCRKLLDESRLPILPISGGLQAQSSPQPGQISCMVYRGIEPESGMPLYALPPQLSQGLGIHRKALPPPQPLQLPKHPRPVAAGGGDPLGGTSLGSTHLGLPPVLGNGHSSLSQSQGFGTSSLLASQGMASLQSLGPSLSSQPDISHLLSSPVKFGSEPQSLGLPSFQSPTKTTSAAASDPFQSPEASPSPLCTGRDEPSSFERHPGLQRRLAEDDAETHRAPTSQSSLIHTKMALFTDSPTRLATRGKALSQPATLVGGCQ